MLANAHDTLAGCVGRPWLHHRHGPVNRASPGGPLLNTAQI